MSLEKLKVGEVQKSEFRTLFSSVDFFQHENVERTTNSTNTTNGIFVFRVTLFSLSLSPLLYKCVVLYSHNSHHALVPLIIISNE